MELDNSGLNKTGEIENPVESPHSSLESSEDDAMTNTETTQGVEESTPGSAAETVELPVLEDEDETAQATAIADDAEAPAEMEAAPEVETSAAAETASDDTAPSETITSETMQPEETAAVEAEAGAEAAPDDAPPAEPVASEPAQAEVRAEADAVVDVEAAIDDAPPAEPVASEPAQAEVRAEADAVVDVEAATDDSTPSEPVTSETTQVEALPFKRGDLVDATITSTSPLQVTVDLGKDVQGIITSHELEKMTRQALEALRPGESIMVFVVNPRDPNGNAIVSINRAIEEMDWQRAEEFRQSQAPYETRVAGYNKGGLIVRFGRVRGFVPQSQLSPERRRSDDDETPEQRWGKMVNEAITVKVMEVDRGRNRLILSERMAAREAREKRKEALVNELNVGEVRTGRVVSLEDFGAFVDVGGAEGLVHLTEVTWQHITHPREVLKVGQEVAVEVISIDRDQKRIGLSMKRQSPDPWDTIAIDYEIGQLVQGTVTKLTKFGAFVQLVDVPEIEGLVHISELSERRVNTPREVVQEGDKLTLRVVKIDVKERRLGLSLKKVNSAEYLDRDMERNWDAANNNNNS